MSRSSAPACPRARSRARRATLALVAVVISAPLATAAPAVAAPVAVRAVAAAALPTVTARPAAPSLVTAADRRRVLRVKDSLRRLRGCESGGNYRINTGNGYYGAYQFNLGTWRALGYPGHPHTAPAPVQDAAAARLQTQRGWGPWPACSRMLGLR